MIVSSPYRAGGTYLAIKLANENNLKYVGQIDNNTVQYTQIEDKNLIHTYKNQPLHTFSDINKWMKDDSDVVILNNSNPALFHRTDTFIMRKDFTNCYISIYNVMFAIHQMPLHVVDNMFKRITFFNGMMVTYIKENNITPLILEEQEWCAEVEDFEVSVPIRSLIDEHVKYLKSL